jgi:drug/metabolite transporter (DMT)-like permease
MGIFFDKPMSQKPFDGLSRLVLMITTGIAQVLLAVVVLLVGIIAWQWIQSTDSLLKERFIKVEIILLVLAGLLFIVIRNFKKQIQSNENQ